LHWTAEQILKLAPDAVSAKAAQGLLAPKKWTSLGANESVLWGACQGSGANPYQTQIDLAEPAFKCSCPSRKFPCKHGLALFLLFAAFLVDCSFVAECCMSIPLVKSGFLDSATILCAPDDIWTGETEKDQNG
jgi:hypothetical protein